MVRGSLDEVSMSARFYDKNRKSVKNLFDCYFNILLAITAWFMHVCSQKSSNSSFKIKRLFGRASSIEIHANYFPYFFHRDKLTFSSNLQLESIVNVWSRQLDSSKPTIDIFGYIRSLSIISLKNLDLTVHLCMYSLVQSTRQFAYGTTPSFFSFFVLAWFGSDKKGSAPKINFLTFSFHLTH